MTPFPTAKKPHRKGAPKWRAITRYSHLPSSLVTVVLSPPSYAAAFELMLERGYTATTMTAIADHAGVAERTLYNLFGSKTGLMLATLRDRASGGEADELAADHEHMRSLEDPLEIIEYAVETNHRVASRAITLFQVAYQAAAVEEEVAAALEELEEQRFHHQGEVINMLQEKGHLREDIPYEVIKRGFWLMAGPETVIKAMKAGWDLDTYSAWLRASLPGLLLPSTHTS